MVVKARGRRELLDEQVQVPAMKLADEKSGLCGAGIGVLSTWAKPAGRNEGCEQNRRSNDSA